MGARTQGGWKLRLPEGRNRRTYLVRFRHAGQRVERSTGCSDPEKAAVEAARIYADIVSGRQVTRVSVATDLATAVASFLADFELENSAEWTEIVTLYFRVHLLPFFGTFEHFTLASYADYGRSRLQKASRPTVRKELSALRRFVAWCAEHGTELPPVPPLPKHGHPGTRAKNARKRKATILTEAEAARILLAMPERSRNTREPVRPLFAVLWETGLRPITVLRLETPLHYKKGAARLFVTREIDKESFERHVPLSREARKALDRVCPDEPGRLFKGTLSALRHWLEAAVRKAGLTHRNISVYDFKHSRISIGANSGAPLAGIAHLVGHKHVSTTALYVTTGEDAARDALAIMSRSPRPIRSAGGHSGGHKAKARSGRSEKPRKTAGAKGGT
jgi:integrase